MAYDISQTPAVEARVGASSTALIFQTKTPEGRAEMRGFLDGLCGPPRIVKGDPRKSSYWAGASEFRPASLNEVA